MKTHRYRRARPFMLFVALALAAPTVAMLPAIAIEKSAASVQHAPAAFVPIPVEHPDVAVRAKPKRKVVRARPRKRAVKRGRSTPALRIGFTWPVKKAEITSPFGWRPFVPWPGLTGPHPARQFHHGADIACAVNQPVVAAKGGRIILSGTDEDYGNVIVIQHAGGWSTLYGHLNKRLVAAGKHVKSRSLIGLCGMTGHANGPHLHFEVRHLGSFYNPLKFLP